MIDNIIIIEDYQIISLTGPPSKPSLNVSSMPGSQFSICFSSYSYYQIKQYSINITDFTGDLLFTSDIQEPSTELCFNNSKRDYPVECTPFNITVKAYNDVGASNISNKELILGNNAKQFFESVYTFNLHSGRYS